MHKKMYTNYYMYDNLMINVSLYGTVMSIRIRFQIQPKILIHRTYPEPVQDPAGNFEYFSLPSALLNKAGGLDAKRSQLKYLSFNLLMLVCSF